MSRLLSAYQQLPQRDIHDDPWLQALGAADSLREFEQVVAANYSEGTLQRLLLSSPDHQIRQAAALALRCVGTMQSNRSLAQALQEDSDPIVADFVHEALWAVWFRGDSAEQAAELKLIMSQVDSGQQIAALDELLTRIPEFAEARNQRAILHFHRGQYSQSISDCDRVLQFNPFHFGAASGKGYCYLRMNRPRAALRSFEHALALNPTLGELQQLIGTLRQSLGDDTADGVS